MSLKELKNFEKERNMDEADLAPFDHLQNSPSGAAAISIPVVVISFLLLFSLIY
jgi:hypothetical protein